MTKSKTTHKAPSIIIHNTRTWTAKPTKASKDRKRAALLGWFAQLKDTPHGIYMLEKLSHAGLSPELTIESLTEAQLKVVLALVSTAYSSGCDSTRKHLAKLRQTQPTLKAVTS